MAFYNGHLHAQVPNVPDQQTLMASVLTDNHKCNNNNNNNNNVVSTCMTSHNGPDLQPVLTPESPRHREAFERAYRLGQMIGQGGFGRVFAGERICDSRPVAIKRIEKEKISSWCTVRVDYCHLILEMLFKKHPPFKLMTTNHV
jgi:serine/threonine protein kinase